MKGTPTGGASERGEERPTEAAPETPPAPTTQQPSSTGSGLAESRAWLGGQGLVRPQQGRMLAGVCQGIARRYGMPVFLVRVLTVVAALAGVGLVAYPAAWVLIPNEK